jgi:hypothetical protein
VASAIEEYSLFEKVVEVPVVTNLVETLVEPEKSFI